MVLWIYFLAYNTLQACNWGELAWVFDSLARRPFWKLYECFLREYQGETFSKKETKEDSSFSYKIWKELLVCAQVMRFSILDRGFDRRDYAAAAKLTHNSNPYWAPNKRSPKQDPISLSRIVMRTTGKGQTAFFFSFNFAVFFFFKE